MNRVVNRFYSQLFPGVVGPWRGTSDFADRVSRVSVGGQDDADHGSLCLKSALAEAALSKKISVR